MTALTATEAGRRAAAATMTDTCVISREAEDPTPQSESYDPDTDEWSPDDPDVTVYEGPCAMQIRDVQGGVTEQGGDVVSTLRYVLKLPIDAPPARVGDRVTMTESPLDPELVDKTFRVRDLFHKSHATSRRLVCEEVTSDVDEAAP